MLLGIPKGVYFRFYGNRVFLFKRQSWMAAFVADVGPFKPLFSYHPVLMEDVASKIAVVHGLTVSRVISDIHELIDPLVIDGYFVCGECVELVDTPRQLQNVSASHVQSPDKNHGVLKSDNDEEALESLTKYFLDHPTPFELCIDLTRACTERCVHCYVPGFQNVFLPYESVEKVLAEFHAMGGLKVKLTGGECMLHPDFERIVTLTSSHDMVISVLSNLTCCDERKAQTMQDVGVAVVQVSIYGMTPETHEAVTRVKGSLAKTLRGIGLLRKAGIPVQIHCPVLKQNVSGIAAVANYGRKIGSKTSFDAVMMSRADHACNGDCDLSESELCQFISVHEDLPEEMPTCSRVDLDACVCEIGTSKICLSAEGKYYPCNGCYGYELGDCRLQTLCEVWNAEPIKRLRALQMRDLSTCQECPNKMFCAPCPARNFNATGELVSPDTAMCRAAQCRRKVVEQKGKRC